MHYINVLHTQPAQLKPWKPPSTQALNNALNALSYKRSILGQNTHLLQHSANMEISEDTC